MLAHSLGLGASCRLSPSPLPGALSSSPASLLFDSGLPPLLRPRRHRNLGGAFRPMARTACADDRERRFPPRRGMARLGSKPRRRERLRRRHRPQRPPLRPEGLAVRARARSSRARRAALQMPTERRGPARRIWAEGGGGGDSPRRRCPARIRRAPGTMSPAAIALWALHGGASNGGPARRTPRARCPNYPVAPLLLLHTRIHMRHPHALATRRAPPDHPAARAIRRKAPHLARGRPSAI